MHAHGFRTNNVDSLQDAKRLNGEALQLCHRGDPTLAMILSEQAITLIAEYTITNDADTLSVAFARLRDVAGDI